MHIAQFVTADCALKVRCFQRGLLTHFVVDFLEIGILVFLF